MMKKPRLITKINVVDTLKEIEINETVLLLQRDIDGSVLRSTASRLTKEGFKFTCTAHENGTAVTRVK